MMHIPIPDESRLLQIKCEARRASGSLFRVLRGLSDGKTRKHIDLRCRYPISARSLLARSLNWNSKARFYAIQYHHRLEALDVGVHIEEAPRKFLIFFHVGGGHV